MPEKQKPEGFIKSIITILQLKNAKERYFVACEYAICEKS